MAHRDLNVLDAAQRAADMFEALIERSPRGQLRHVRQMRNAIQSISANIGEAFGRRPGRDRNRSLEIARAESEEAIRHLHANYRVRRVSRKDYWPFHNILVVIVKMLNSMING